MTLYEINEAILGCIDMETGEIIDIEKLNALQMERREKIESVALWIKELDAEADAIKNEEDKLKRRREVLQNKEKSLKHWLSGALNGQKFETSKCALSFRKSIAVDVNEEVFFASGSKLISYKPMYCKADIKDILKSGCDVPGCVLVENINLQIK